MRVGVMALMTACVEVTGWRNGAGYCCAQRVQLGCSRAAEQGWGLEEHMCTCECDDNRGAILTVLGLVLFFIYIIIILVAFYRIRTLYERASRRILSVCTITGGAAAV